MTHPPITDEMVERAAISLCANWFSDDHVSPKQVWDDCSQQERDYFLRVALAALRAASIVVGDKI